MTGMIRALGTVTCRALAALLVLAPAPVLALSCLPQTVPDTYHQAEDSPARYHVIHGVLDFDASKLPVPDIQNQAAIPPQTLIPAHIKGYRLSREGFVTEAETDLVLDVRCFGPWCASAVSGKPYLAFLKEQEDGTLSLEVTPCGGFGFAEPPKQALTDAIACARGETCPKSDMIPQ